MSPFATAAVGVLALCLFGASAAIADPPNREGGRGGAVHGAPAGSQGGPGGGAPSGGAGKGPPGGDSLGAGWRQQQDEVRQGVTQRRLAPLAQVIEQIRLRTPGRQLDAGLEYQGDRAVYRVRWMTTDGRRIDYIIDATTGAILSGH